HCSWPHSNCCGDQSDYAMKISGEIEALFSVLRQSAKPEPVSAIEKLIEDAPDRELCRINALAFAAEHKLDEEDVAAAFLPSARAADAALDGMLARDRLELRSLSSRSRDISKMG